MVRTEWARIPVKPDTRDNLRAAKTGGETYDDVLRRLLSDTDSRRTKTRE